MKTSRILLVIILMMVAILIIKFYPQSNDNAASSTNPDSVFVTPVAATKGATYTINHLSIKQAAQEYRYHNLQLYPIYASAEFLVEHKKLGPYLSLEQALAKQKVSITELDGANGGAVNTLLIENISADTIIVLGGEVIRGGKQDRMIAQDFMLMPHSGAVDIDVYCVEHNRWQAADRKASFDISLGLAPAAVREAAKDENSQQEVWDQVDVLYERYGVEDETKALADALADEDLKGDLHPYLEKLGDIYWAPNVVGVIAVRGNQIVGSDVFAQPALFARFLILLIMPSTVLKMLSSPL